MEEKLAKELERLAQGIIYTKGTNIIRLIANNILPRGLVVCFWTHKYEMNHTRLTVGGDRIDYPRDASTPTLDITMTKNIFSFNISTPGATFVIMDAKKFYLNMLFNLYYHICACN